MITYLIYKFVNILLTLLHLSFMVLYNYYTINFKEVCKMKKVNFRACIAEFLGTFMLTFFGCAAACTVGTEVKGGYFMTALTFGLILTVMCYCIGPISGCHVNPAVTLAMFINKKIKGHDALSYAVSQVIGAVLAGGLLSVFFKPEKGLGSNSSAGVGIIVALAIEIILTFTFILAIFGATSKKENSSISGIIIGAALTMVHIIGIHFTGTSVNPARSLGPALFAGITALSDVWIFIIAPLIGAVLAAFTWKFLIQEKK